MAKPGQFHAKCNYTHVSNLPSTTESNFKDRQPTINDALHNCQQSLSIFLV